MSRKTATRTAGRRRSGRVLRLEAGEGAWCFLIFLGVAELLGGGK